MLIHDTLALEPTPLMNEKTSDNPIEILENYIETVTNDHDDENVYEINPVITWETLKKYRETSDCEPFNLIIDKFEGTKLKLSWSRPLEKMYILILRIRLKFYKMLDLYKLSSNILDKNCGSGLRYKRTTFELLNSLYENYKFIAKNNKKLQECKMIYMEIYKKHGIDALSYSWLVDNKFEYIYKWLQKKKYSLEDFAIEHNIHDEYIEMQQNKKIIWNEKKFWEEIDIIYEKYKRIPTADFLRMNGYNGLVNHIKTFAKDGIDEIKKQYNCDTYKNISVNGMLWRSESEVCMSNFLYSRCIPHKTGEKYKNDFYDIFKEGAVYDIHFLGLSGIYRGKWINVEIFGGSRGHDESRYKIKKDKKKEYHKEDKFFLSIDWLECKHENKLSVILKKYIGLIKSHYIPKKQYQNTNSTCWSLLDIIIPDVKIIVTNLGHLPSHDWFTRQKRYKNRKIEDWEKTIKTNKGTLSNFISKCGGYHKIRKILYLTDIYKKPKKIVVLNKKTREHLVLDNVNIIQDFCNTMYTSSCIRYHLNKYQKYVDEKYEIYYKSDWIRINNAIRKLQKKYSLRKNN